MEQKRNAIKQIFTFSISTWANFGIGVISTVILTRIFSAEMYGEINVFNTAAATLMSVLCMGFDSGYIRYYNEPPRNNDRIQLAFKLLVLSLSISLTASLAIGILFWRQFSLTIFGHPSLALTVLLLVNVLSNLILRYYTITYRMTFNALQYTVQNILVQLITKSSYILAAVFTMKINKIIGFSVLSLFILVAVYTQRQKKDIIPEKINLDYRGFSPVIRFSLFSAPTYIVLNVNAFFSQMIIRQSIGMNAVGIFSSVNAFVAILNVLKGGFGTYWSAFMYANYKTEQELIKKIHNYVMLCLAVVFAMVICFKDLIYLMIGPEFHASKSFFSLLMLYPILNIAMETTIYGLSIRNKTHITLFIHFVSVALNLLLSLFLTGRYGLVGTAWASALSGLLLFVMGTLWGQSYYPSVSRVRTTLAGVSLLFFMAVIPVYLKNNFYLILTMAALTLAALKIYQAEMRTALAFLKKYAGGTNDYENRDN